MISCTVSMLTVTCDFAGTQPQMSRSADIVDLDESSVASEVCQPERTEDSQAVSWGLEYVSLLPTINLEDGNEHKNPHEMNTKFTSTVVE